MKVMISDLTDDLAKNLPLANATIVKITYKDGKYYVDGIGNTEYINKGKATLGK